MYVCAFQTGSESFSLSSKAFHETIRLIFQGITNPITNPSNVLVKMKSLSSFIIKLMFNRMLDNAAMPSRLAYAHSLALHLVVLY